MRQTDGIKLVRALLVLAVGVSLARLGFLKSGQDWVASTRAESVPPAPAAGPAEDAWSWPRPTSPEQLAHGRLFASSAPAESPPPEDPDVTVAPESFAYELVGTLVTSDPELRQALFRHRDSQATVSAKLRQSVGSAVVEQIERHRVTLRSPSGQRFVVAQETFTPRSVPVPVGPRRTDVPPYRYRGENFHAALEQILSDATLEPVVEKGRPVGLRIDNLADLPLAQMAGLRDGDIITALNGQRLANRQKAVQVFKKAKAVKHLTLELLRQGRTSTLSFDLP